jgi:hypothetical protein
VAKRLCKIMTGIADARTWANELVRRESRGPGDMENAMRRLEARYGISWRTFWTMKYRPPTDVFVGVYLTLKAAYEAECQRQERRFAHERRITEAKVLSVETMAQSGNVSIGKGGRSPFESPDMGRSQG